MIQRRIITVLRDRFHLSETVLAPDNWDKPLTGHLFNLSGTDLVYLLFELERAFNIRIPERYLETYGFCSIDRINEAIRDQGYS
jgi:acyl carrier protein